MTLTLSFDKDLDNCKKPIESAISNLFKYFIENNLQVSGNQTNLPKFKCGNETVKQVNLQVINRMLLE